MRQLLRKLLLTSFLVSAGCALAWSADCAPVTDTLMAVRRKVVHSINAQIGTTGPRLFYNRSVGASRRLMLRAGVQYIAYRKPFPVKLDKNASITVQPDFMIGLAEVGTKWQLFRGRALYVTTALAYNWHPTLQLTLTAKDKLSFDGLELTPEDVGVINLGFQWRRIMPYVGLGLGKPLPKRRFSVGFEMGLFYLGRPRVLLDYEGFLEATTIDEQVPAFERNLAQYRYLPTVNLSLTYQLSYHP